MCTNVHTDAGVGGAGAGIEISEVDKVDTITVRGNLPGEERQRVHRPAYAETEACRTGFFPRLVVGVYDTLPCRRG